MSLADEIGDLLHDEGPKTLEQLREHFPGWHPKQITNAAASAVKKQKIHNTMPLGVAALYKWGPPEGWLPSPLPVSSVWEWRGKRRAVA